jgi:SAM-dependent methyltransferase
VTSWLDTPPPPELLASGSPLIDTEDIPCCPVCGHDAFTTYAVGFDYESHTCRNPWRFVQCARCAHVWLNPRPALSALPVIYPSTYYAYTIAEEVSPLALKAKDWLELKKLRSIVSHCDALPSAYLDVGCGHGRLLQLLERQGVARDRLYGLDLDERTVRPLAQQGYRASVERVEDCTHIPEATLDLVTMFHVIEHVDDPGAVMRRIASWMAPGGVLAIETPNIDSTDARWFRSGYWGGYHIPRHWNLFHPGSLAQLLRDAGFEVFGMEHQTGHACWMLSFHHRLRYGPPPRLRLSRVFDPFTNWPLLGGFTVLDRVRAAIGCKTSAVMALARKPRA